MRELKEVPGVAQTAADILCLLEPCQELFFGIGDVVSEFVAVGGANEFTPCLYLENNSGENKREAQTLRVIEEYGLKKLFIQ